MAEEVAGQRINERDPNVEAMSDEELEQAISDIPKPPPPPALPDEEIPEDIADLFKQAVDAPVEEKAVETPTPPPVQQVGSAEPQEEVQSEAEVEKAALLAEMERRDAALKLQQAHSSRLAGEIGFLRKKMESLSRTPSDEVPEQTELDSLRGEIEKLRSERTAEEVSRAIADAARPLLDPSGHPDLKALTPEELKGIAANYEQYWSDAVASNDPKMARLLAEAVTVSVIADAKTARLRKAAEEARSRSLDQAEQLRRKKLEATAPKTAAATVKSRPKTWEELPEKEQDRLLDALLRQNQ